MAVRKYPGPKYHRNSWATSSIFNRPPSPRCPPSSLTCAPRPDYLARQANNIDPPVFAFVRAKMMIEKVLGKSRRTARILLSVGFTTNVKPKTNTYLLSFGYGLAAKPLIFPPVFQHTSKCAPIGRGLARFVGRRLAVPAARAC